MQLAKCSQCSFVYLSDATECSRCGALVSHNAPRAFASAPPAGAHITISEATSAPPELTPPQAGNFPTQPASLAPPTALELAYFSAPAAPENAEPNAAFTHSDFALEANAPPDESALPRYGNYPPLLGTGSQAQITPPHDPQYYAARAAARETTQSLGQTEQRRFFLAQPQYAPQRRPLTQYANSGSSTVDNVETIFGNALFKLIIYPLVALALLIGAWNIVASDPWSSSEDPRLPRAHKPWFNSWVRSNPTAEEVRRQYIKATGQQAFANLPKTLYFKGSMEIFKVPLPLDGSIAPPPPGDYERATFLRWVPPGKNIGIGDFEAANDKGRQVSFITSLKVLNKTIRTQQTLTSQKAWKHEIVYNGLPKAGIIESEKTSDLSPPETAQFKKMSSLGVLEQDSTQTFQFLGKADVRGRVAYSLKAKKPNGEEETQYYDAETGLVVCTQEVDAAKGLEMTIFFEEYRLVEGVQVPHKMLMMMSAEGVKLSITMQIEDIKTNTPLDPQLFTWFDSKAANSNISNTTTFATQYSPSPSPTPTTGLVVRKLPPVYAPPRREPEPRPSASPQEKPFRSTKSGGLFDGLAPVNN